MNQESGRVFRVLTFLFAAVLGVQSAWLLFAGVASHFNATWAAMIGGIRGDLWAESAFKNGDLIWGDAGQGAQLAQASSSLDHALADAPHQSSAWLMLAGVASRFHLTGIDAKEALKMSYYTGSSVLDLMPLRLWITARLDAFSDTEFHDSISREVRLLITHQQKSAIVAAYIAAQPAGRQFIENAIREIDPSAVESLRATAQKSHSSD
jgi:hypothetical protein